MAGRSPDEERPDDRKYADASHNQSASLYTKEYVFKPFWNAASP